MGLEAPLYVAAGHKKRQQDELAAAAYQGAIRRYTKLIPDLPTPEAALTVKGYLVLAYQQLGEWDNAVALLEEMEAAPQQVNRPMVLLSLGSIYQAKRGDNAKAHEIYTKLAEEFPDHPFGKIAKARLRPLTP
jgi:tetratricopeptide (TPR) repeat protein